jgi:hypothetical protein
LILQNNSTLSQLPVCHSNQLLTAAKPDHVPLDSLKNLDESEVEAFRSLVCSSCVKSISLCLLTLLKNKGIQNQQKQLS